MDTGRNEPCPCGSGKKYKKCCLGKNPSSSKASNRVGQLSLRDRNVVLLNAIGNIFGLDRGIEWDEIRRTISGAQIRELYEVIGRLWPPDTDVASLLPKPESKLRAVYVGHLEPDALIRNVFRFALYTDEILIFDPFPNPWWIAEEYNPLVSPDQYRADTLKLVLLMMLLGEWIADGFVTLIPDPRVFDNELRTKTSEMAQRRTATTEPDPSDLEYMREHAKDHLFRFVSTLPLGARKQSIRAVLPEISAPEMAALLAEMDQRRKADVLALDQPVEQAGDQLFMHRLGANLETAVYVANLTGAFPYTNVRSYWRELLSSRDSDLPVDAALWSPLTKAFQDLEFKFLNRVHPQFVKSIRSDGRLEGFRSFLRRVWGEVGGERDARRIESLSRDFHDELTSQYHQAREDWAAIDRDLLKWWGATGSAAISAFATGKFVPEFLIGGLGIAAVTELMLTNSKRKAFRRTTPMSVFIDLNR